MLDNIINDDDKIFKGGPTCKVGNCLVPPFVVCSTNGGISGDILTNCLKHIVKHMNYDRIIATPTLFLDLHGSRFEEFLLSYINPEQENEGNK